MGPKHDRQHILRAALELAVDEGLRHVTFGKVARRLGLPDRTVVYYFPSKVVLLREVLGAASAGLAEVLRRAFQEPARSPAELAARAWPVMSSEDADSVFRLFFDAVGLTMHDSQDLRPAVQDLMSAWVSSLEPLFAGDEATRRARAEATLALLDGLLLLHFTLGPDSAARAARELLGDAAPARAHGAR